MRLIAAHFPTSEESPAADPPLLVRIRGLLALGISERITRMRSSGPVVEQIHTLYRLGSVGSFTDSQLLDRFLDRTDPEASEAAFSELIERHGPMVLSLCRRHLGETQDAHDAFQATFLVLVRKAGSIRNRDALGSWLFGIASRVARQARAEDCHRKKQLQRLVERCPDRCEPTAVDEAHGPEGSWEELHEEMERLPETIRAPLILHYFEGQSTESIARMLGCQRGTVLSRLARARMRLRQRLERRGISTAAVLPLSVLGHKELLRAVPRGLAQTVVRCATSMVLSRSAIEGVAPQAVAHLAVGAMKSLVVMQIRKTAVLVLAVVLMDLTYRSLAGSQAGKAPTRASLSQSTTPKKESPARPNTRGMVELRGLVLDPDGRPAAGAEIFVGARFNSKRPDEGLPRRAVAGPDGRFGFTMEQKELEPDLPSTGSGLENRVIGAVARGFGPGWTRISSEGARGEFTISLRRDDVPISGRVIDLEGRPIRGLRVVAYCISAFPGRDARRPGPGSAGTTAQHPHRR